jgi:predicted nucleic acid-binding protein
VIIYAESSAVLSWLLGEASSPQVLEILEAATFVVTSDLTLLECDRAFHRAHSLGELSPERHAELRAELGQLSEYWILLRLNNSIVERAREAFPGPPIRSLDALHLASVLHAAASNPGIALLTLDERIRSCARALGLRILPPSG